MTELQTIPGILPPPCVLKKEEPELYYAMYQHPEWFDDFIQSKQDKRKKVSHITEEDVIRWVEQYMDDHDGKYPTSNSGLIKGINKTWASLDSNLRHGYNGCQKGSSLPKFIDAHFDRDNSITLEQIEEAVRVYMTKNGGKFPSSAINVSIPGLNTSWMSLDKCFKKGFRNLPKGYTLATFLNDRFERTKPTTIDKTNLVKWISEYIEKEFKLPSVDSQEFISGTDLKWSTIRLAFIFGRRGVSQGSSFKCFVKDHFCFPLTEYQFLQWVIAYRKEYGKFPKKHSGWNAGPHSKNWLSVDSSMKLRKEFRYNSLSTYIIKIKSITRGNSDEWFSQENLEYIFQRM